MAKLTDRLIDPAKVVALHDQLVTHWHSAPVTRTVTDPLMAIVEDNHANNFELWHEEDKARDKDADNAIIAQVKHNIDGFNQRRNDAMERIDEWVTEQLSTLAPEVPESVPLHSETVGSIVDRLSILSLKRYHMGEETLRKDATEEHIATCQGKLGILSLQRDDLAEALGRFLEELASGQKRFRVYRQMKMYNDPRLNPVLYGKANKR